MKAEQRHLEEAIKLWDDHVAVNFVVVGQALAAAEHRGASTRALELWAMDVLNAWIDLPSRGGSWRVTRNDAVSKTENEFMVELVEDEAEEDPPIYLAASPADAMIEAARALKLVHHELPDEPKGSE